MDKIAEIILSSGMISLAIFGICKWLLKHIIEESIVTHNEKVMARFNSILDQQSKILSLQLNYREHILKFQYDVEIENYLQIWKALQKYIEATVRLKDFEDKPAYDFEMQNSNMNLRKEYWEKCRKKFAKLVNGNAPFYQKEHYEKFIELDNMCRQLYTYYEGKNFVVLVDEEYSKKSISKILELQEQLLDELRQYLKMLKQIEE